MEQDEGMFENRTMRTGSMTLSPFDLFGTHNRAAGASIMVGVGRWDEESQTAQQLTTSPVVCCRVLGKASGDMDDGGANLGGEVSEV